MEEFVKDPPKRFVANDRIHRLSTIYFAISITCLCVTVLAVFSSFIIPLFHGFIIVCAVFLLLLSLLLVVFTFGTILLAENHPTKIIYEFISNSDMGKSVKIAQKFIDIVPYLCYVGIAASLISLIAVLFCKRKSKAGRIVGTVIFMVVLGLILALYYIMGGVLWQEF